MEKKEIDQRLVSLGYTPKDLFTLTCVHRRTGEHANLVLNIIQDQDRFILKTAEHEHSIIARRAIQKEVNILSQLNKNAVLNPYLPTARNIIRKPTLAVEYDYFNGTPFNEYLTESYAPEHWHTLYQQVTSFLITLAKKDNNQRHFTLKKHQKFCIDTPFQEISPHFKDADQLKEYVINALPSDLEGPFVAMHGDFNAWNILIGYSRDTSELPLCYLDWEDCSRWGLPLFDFFYFSFVNTWVLLFEDSPFHGPEDLSSETIPQLLDLFIELVTQYSNLYMDALHLNAQHLDAYFLLFLVRQTLEDIRPKRNNPDAATRWYNLLRYQFEAPIFLSSIRFMFLQALLNKATETKNKSLKDAIEKEIAALTSQTVS